MDTGVGPTKPSADSASKPATKMFTQANDKAARLQLYVKDKKLIKELKLAAVEDDLSIPSPSRNGPPTGSTSVIRSKKLHISAYIDMCISIYALIALILGPEH